MDNKLSLLTRMKLRIHFLMCSFCERYMKQLKYIRDVAREFPEKIGDVSDATLPSEVKQRLKDSLRLLAGAASTAALDRSRSRIQLRCKESQPPLATNRKTRIS